MNGIVARSAGRFVTRTLGYAAQSRSQSTSDIRARGHEKKVTKGTSKVAEDPSKISQLINDKAHSSEPSFKGAEEVVDEAYKRGGVKDGGLDQGTPKYRPVPGNQTNAEKDPVGKRRFSTDATLQLQFKATFATKTPPKPVAGVTGDRGVKVNRDVDYDSKKGPDGKPVNTGMKNPVGQVIGREGLESVDGGKHQHSSDTMDKNKRKPSPGKTTTGSDTV